MPKMLLLFSHELTQDQIKDARATLNITEFVPLSVDLEGLWKNIPPTKPSLSEYLEPLRRWMKGHAEPGDYVLIQGDFGAVYLMVNFAFSAGLIPVYSTTEREVVEKALPDNTVRSERVFRHRMFRRYEKE
ncbi:MAG TPA: CRISPR-associated protein Csx20 [Candidatus Limnocylindrales bacterium]|nr:CRISPR-associated protein Csx20 [Candidatus Limnocylindrales bacterium]